MEGDEAAVEQLRRSYDVAGSEALPGLALRLRGKAGFERGCEIAVANRSVFIG